MNLFIEKFPSKLHKVKENSWKSLQQNCWVKSFYKIWLTKLSHDLWSLCKKYLRHFSNICNPWRAERFLWIKFSIAWSNLNFKNCCVYFFLDLKKMRAKLNELSILIPLVANHMACSSNGNFSLGYTWSWDYKLWSTKPQVTGKLRYFEVWGLMLSWQDVFSNYSG